MERNEARIEKKCFTQKKITLGRTGKTTNNSIYQIQKGYHVRVYVLNGVITKISKTEDANTSGAATNPRSNKQTYTM
jgi:uncharacterized protein (DUF2147 family)